MGLVCVIVIIINIIVIMTLILTYQPPKEVASFSMIREP